MTRSPKLSIVTPSYNLGRYLERAITSVLKQQDYDNFEYWVIDGGSRDNTVKILKRYSRNPRFKNKFFWLSEPDKGQTDAINKGLERATGDWFAWLNADDYYQPQVFGKLIQAMQRYPKAGVIYGNNRTHRGNRVRKDVPPQNVTLNSFFNGNVIFGPAAFFRTEAIRQGDGFQANLQYWMDYDMFMRLIKQYRFQYLDLEISNFTIRPQQKSTNKQLQRKLHKEAHLVCRNNGGPFFSQLLINRLPQPLRTLVRQLSYLFSVTIGP